MPTDLPIRCSCGAFRGIARGVTPGGGSRVICYCGDCQSFAHSLGRADEILDAHGGTDIIQISPARLEFTEGAEHLACMRLTAKGLLRWHTGCCNTPIGNTLPTHKVPFVGLIHNCFDTAGGGARLDEAVGPVRTGVNGRFAKGDRAGLKAHDRAPPSYLVRTLGLLLMWRLRGDHKCSPFFVPQSGEPVVEPRILTGQELAQVERGRDAWPAAESH